jgi:hypothetical protein
MKLEIFIINFIENILSFSVAALFFSRTIKNRKNLSANRQRYSANGFA